MADRETREVIYTDGGRSGGGSAAIVAVAVLALIVVLFLVFGRGLIGGSDTKTIKADVDISGPSKAG